MNLKLINIKSLGGVHKEGTKWLRGADLAHFPTIENAYLIIKEGKISSFGPMSNCPQDELPVQNCNGQHVMPAFVDSHSHLVYAGTREEEFNLRLKGASYEEIAAAGGGILNSAAKVSTSNIDELVGQAQFRLQNLIDHGTGTLEVKSGYGLDPENELKLLRAIKTLNKKSSATLIPTFLAAHALPAWAKAQGMDDASYTKYMLEQCLPILQSEGLALFLDGFIERDYFKLNALQHLIDASAQSGLPLKIHVNQFYDIGGIEMAVAAQA